MLKSRVLTLAIVFSTSLLLFAALLAPKTCIAYTVVWQDDFDDGNYDGWSTSSQAGFSAANGYLETQIDSTWSWISRPSDVAYGSWQFDVYAVDTPANHCYVYIISSGINYRLCVWTGSWTGGITIPGPGFDLLKEIDDVTEIASYYPGTPVTGWYTINFTRTEAGEFSIYIDSVLRMQVTDNDITESTTFRFAAQGGWRIDNVVVSSLPSTSTPPPPGIPGFPIEALLLAIPLALTVAMLRRRK
jgi:hypothetical protein